MLRAHSKSSINSLGEITKGEPKSELVNISN